MRKLAIVGSHSGTRDNAPWTDASFDLWLFNEAPQNDWAKRWTGCFQLHKPEVYTSLQNVNNAGHWPWLQTDHGAGKTIYMQDADPRVPNAKRYPMEEICAALPAASFRWFTSTVSMALALALYQGYEYIEVYGVDLSSGTEYAYQQANWLYWVGAAKSILGDNLVLCSGQQHFSARVYGYEGDTTIDTTHFAARVAELEPLHSRALTEYNRARNKASEAVADFKPETFAEGMVQAHLKAQELGEVAGRLQEARNYAARTDPISRQQFERHAAAAQRDGEIERMDMQKLSGIVEYVWNVWKTTPSPEAIKQLRMFLGKMLEKAVRTGGNYGVWQENLAYCAEYDARVTAAGGRRTLETVGQR